MYTHGVCIKGVYVCRSMHDAVESVLSMIHYVLMSDTVLSRTILSCLCVISLSMKFLVTLVDHVQTGSS